ncbi:MAG: hypothetical protein ACTXOO_03450 [Sodalis sp. (in: enterobacteria)]
MPLVDVYRELAVSQPKSREGTTHRCLPFRRSEYDVQQVSSAFPRATRYR